MPSTDTTSQNLLMPITNTLASLNRKDPVAAHWMLPKARLLPAVANLKSVPFYSTAYYTPYIQSTGIQVNTKLTRPMQRNQLFVNHSNINQLIPKLKHKKSTPKFKYFNTEYVSTTSSTIIPKLNCKKSIKFNSTFDIALKSNSSLTIKKTKLNRKKSTRLLRSQSKLCLELKDFQTMLKDV
ncbi:hypothetical protein HDV02_002244 [Globomyces sp. JEL0801]|nr:hypothetical protein HDV02_002244 [Globomyces sp. JEL0801]